MRLACWIHTFKKESLQAEIEDQPGKRERGWPSEPSSNQRRRLLSSKSVKSGLRFDSQLITALLS